MNVAVDKHTRYPLLNTNVKPTKTYKARVLRLIYTWQYFFSFIIYFHSFCACIYRRRSTTIFHATLVICWLTSWSNGVHTCRQYIYMNKNLSFSRSLYIYLLLFSPEALSRDYFLCCVKKIPSTGLMDT